jgi:hypothetical protein
MRPHQFPKLLAARGIDVKAESDKALQLALKYPHGSEMRRSFIEAALMLEPPPPGRPKGTTKPQINDTFARTLMWRIALQTGEREAEPLARLAVDTGLLVEKATKPSTITRLAKGWRKQQAARGSGRATETVATELERQAVERQAKGICVEDPDTVVRQLRDDPFWQQWAQRVSARRNE